MHNYFKHIRTAPRQRGVTLIELMVTLAIFTAVTTILLGVFLALFSAREHIDIAQKANDDVRLLLDGIDREIQAGSNIVVSEGGSAIQFTVSSRGDTPPYRVEYRLRDNSIEKAVQKNTPRDPCQTLVGGTLPETCHLPVTGERVRVSDLQFSVITPEEEQGQTSPLVTLGLRGFVEDSAGNGFYITYSTSITPRNRITVSDVEPTPPTPPPTMTLIAIRPGRTADIGCVLSIEEAPPVVPPIGPFGTNVDYGTFYTDCINIALEFSVQAPAPAGLHSFRYVGPGSNGTFVGTGQTVPVTVVFDNVLLQTGMQGISVTVENLMGMTVSQGVAIDRRTNLGGGGGGGTGMCTYSHPQGTHTWAEGTSVTVGGISGISCAQRFCCEGARFAGDAGISICDDIHYMEEECP